MSRFAVIVELYSQDGKPKSRPRLHTAIYASQEIAQAYIDEARRQNLPFKSTEVVELITT